MPPTRSALGGVPLERIFFEPPPGTATEADLLRYVERDKRLCELIDGTLVEKPVDTCGLGSPWNSAGTS